MRISNSEHESGPWRIREIAPDFRLEDAWALPATGSAGDFGSLIEVMSSLDPTAGGSRATRVLFKIRHGLGGVFGWDDEEPLPISGSTETTLSARLPEDLRDTAREPASNVGATQFVPLYRTDREWAAEVSNRTVHGVLHLGWVERAEGRYQGEMGIYVKPRGTFGKAYMAAISPFRHLIVYPALMRQIEQAWNARVRP